MNTKTDEKWIERLTVELRLREVPGRAIGDAIASVRELLADSGESAEEAFGSPEEYAAALALPADKKPFNGVRTVLIPGLSLIVFLAYGVAVGSFLREEPLLLSVPQVLLTTVPLLVVLLFARPEFTRFVVRHWWAVIVIMLIGAASGGVGAMLAPETASEAWLVVPPTPVLVGTVVLLVLIACIGTVLSLRGEDDDAVVEPLAATDTAMRRHRARVIIVNWIFVIFAVVMYGLVALLVQFAGA